MINLGVVPPGSTIEVEFDTFDGGTGASITMSGLLVSDIEVYKDGGTTQRASDSGYTLLDTDGIDFDGITGVHGFSINLADNTTAGFWAAGSRYTVVVSAITVDGQTVSFIAAKFQIGYRDAVLNTTIASLSSQTSFTLTSGPAEDDALNGCVVCIHDVASAVQLGFAVIADYTGSTKTVTLTAGVTFTAAATDNVAVFPPSASRWSAATLEVATGTHLTAIPWNAAWDAEVQSEVTDGLNAYDPPTRAELTSDINSVIAYLDGLVIAKGTIGATGNTTTALHLAGLTYGDDEINNYLIAVKDVSAGEWHARYIEDWANTGDLATVATLPFTPEASVDLYVVLAFRQDVTGGAGLDAAGVRAAVGLASANLDAQLDALPTAAEVVNEWESQSQADPTGFHVNVLEVAGTAQTANDIGADVNEILIDTSTTLQAELDGIQADTEDIQSKLGTPSDFGSGTSTIAANLQDMADNGTAAFDRSTDSLQAIRDHVGDGTNLTEAGGTGDHLTAINLPNQTMDIVGNITGNLSGSVGSVAGLTIADLEQIVDDLQNGGRLDLLIDAIKAKTDSLTFTQAGHVDANVQRINDVTITGDGDGTPFDVA